MICRVCNKDKNDFYKNHKTCKSCLRVKFLEKEKKKREDSFSAILNQLPKDVEVKEIPNTKGLYFATSNGRIIRKKKNSIVLEFAKDNGGYYYVCLSIDGKAKKEKVHRLIGKTFLKHEDGKNIINHKNFNKEDNRVENLEWCTISENTSHYYREHKNPIVRCSQFSLSDKENMIKLSKSGATTKSIGDKYNISHATVSMIINGRIKNFNK